MSQLQAVMQELQQVWPLLPSRELPCGPSLWSPAAHVQLRQQQAAHEDLSAKFSQLLPAFQYNLQLLADRDAELQQYDATTAVQV